MAVFLDYFELWNKKFTLPVHYAVCLAFENAPGMSSDETSMEGFNYSSDFITSLFRLCLYYIKGLTTLLISSVRICQPSFFEVLAGLAQA